MDDVERTLADMQTFLSPALAETIERVRHFEVHELGATLERLKLLDDEIAEIVGHWPDLLRDDEWVCLLAGLLDHVEVHRGNPDAPIGLWSDLDDAGPSGRLLFIYLFALCYEGARAFLGDEGFPEHVIDATFDILARHCATHQRKWGTVGVDAGWWMLPALRGELVQVGSLQFHRVTLGVGSLTPQPWYNESDTAQLGVGFRRGDASLGLHIPQGADLSPTRLDETFDEARLVLGRLWPVEQRRLVTCMTWMMDERVPFFLDETTNLVRFRERFCVLAAYDDNDEDVLDFVFRSPGTALGDLPQDTRLQRGIVQVLQHAEHWHTGTGWFDFDGV